MPGTCHSEAAGPKQRHGLTPEGGRAWPLENVSGSTDARVHQPTVRSIFQPMASAESVHRRLVDAAGCLNHEPRMLLKATGYGWFHGDARHVAQMVADSHPTS